MCGIAGYWGRTDAGKEAEPLLRAMATALAHRGPDDAGVWLEYNTYRHGRYGLDRAAAKSAGASASAIDDDRRMEAEGSVATATAVVPRVDRSDTMVRMVETYRTVSQAAAT